VFLDLSFAAERWLRHTGRLARNSGVAEKVLSALSIVFAIAGTCGLILLSIFDTLRYPRLHDGFLLLFMLVTCLRWKWLSLMMSQSWLCHLSYFYMCGVPTIGRALPPAPCPAGVFLVEARIYPYRDSYGDSFHCHLVP